MLAAMPASHAPDGPHFDRAQPGRRDLRGNGHGIVQILGLNQIVAAELLARLGERTIGRLNLSVSDTNGRRRRRRPQSVRPDELPGFLNVVREGPVLGQQGVHLFVAHLRLVRFRFMDHQQVLHGSLPQGWESWSVARLHPLVERGRPKSTTRQTTGELHDPRFTRPAIYTTRGSVTAKLAPSPGVLVTAMSPCMARTRSREIANPRPMPPWVRVR